MSLIKIRNIMHDKILNELIHSHFRLKWTLFLVSLTFKLICFGIIKVNNVFTEIVICMFYRINVGTDYCENETYELFNRLNYVYM